MRFQYMYSGRRLHYLTVVLAAIIGSYGQLTCVCRQPLGDAGAHVCETLVFGGLEDAVAVVAESRTESTTAHELWIERRRRPQESGRRQPCEEADPARLSDVPHAKQLEVVWQSVGHCQCLVRVDAPHRRRTAAITYE